MRIKKIPMRTCVVTKEKCAKKDLIRIVRTPQGEVLVDVTGKQNGKGAYLKLSEEVILKAQKNKILDRTLEVNVPNEIYEKLRELVSKKESEE